jgi:predicted ATP-grasp superfamily ATP-dependent carboligase
MKEAHAPPFAWCGTITPIALPEGIVTNMRRAGEVITARAGLRGLFGCDFLVEGDKAWLTEVNPRYPASTELVEHVLGVPLLDWHRRVFEEAKLIIPAFAVPPSGGVVPPASAARNTPSEGGTANIIGKIILYADRDLVAPDISRFVSHPLPWLASAVRHDDSLPSIADIPPTGQAIGHGQPICTLFASGSTESECLAELIRYAERFERLLK